ncbi:hypothetical protein [Nesterenkonia muleiensis]|uniref:hypothetical protein n=1 Tax=Nesterenkonia muleiensis TaxID=2282648 RepID=UPI000E74C397|nr:hypothetical protein [Nesterenkonia muleiensis]
MTTTVEIPVPENMSPEEARHLAEDLLQRRSAFADFARDVELKPDLVHPSVAWHVVAVDHMWRKLIDKYGVYTSADIARLRGANPQNRSVATNLAKRENILSFTRAGKKLYPRFQFKGDRAHPEWKHIVEPLLNAGWDSQDILLWLTGPNGAIDGREPAELIGTDEVNKVITDAEDEAKGIW